MNFFYGISNNLFKSEIQIPLFQNRNFKKSNLKLFKSYPKNNKWILQEISSKKINDYFYILKNEDILTMLRGIIMKTLLSLFVLFFSSSVMCFAGLTSGAVKE